MAGRTGKGYLRILSGCRQHPKGRWLPFGIPQFLNREKHTVNGQVKPIVQRGRPALAGRSRHPWRLYAFTGSAHWQYLAITRTKGKAKARWRARVASTKSYRKIRSIYPVSPEQFYSPNRIVSGSQVVKEIPARWPVWQYKKAGSGPFYVSNSLH